MDIELNALETKITKVVSLCHSLRDENRNLQERVKALEAEKNQLVARIDSARGRLEALVSQLPEETV